MNVRSVLRMCVALVLVGLSSSMGSTVAQDATPAQAGLILPPDAEVDGMNLAEWSARSWQWFFTFPPDIDPSADDTGARCGYGQSGPVFFLTIADHSLERSCVVPLGMSIFVPLLGSECSTVESPPFFGRDEAELRSCATDAVNHAERAFDMATMQLMVDGRTIDNLSAYRAVTPIFTLLLPEENLLGSSIRVANSVGDGYQVMLSPLPVGEHVVTIVLPGSQPNETVTITYRLTVASGAHVDPSASPEATPSS